MYVCVPLTVTAPPKTVNEPSEVGDTSRQSMTAEKSAAVAPGLASVNEETGPVNGTPSVSPAIVGCVAATFSGASVTVAVVVVVAVVGVEPGAPPLLLVTVTVTA